MLERLRTLVGRGAPAVAGCGCDAAVDGTTVTVDAVDCEAGGALATAPCCRATAVGAVGDRSVTAVRTTAAGRVREYRGEGAALIAAAGRFQQRVAGVDRRLARRARRDPLAAAREAAARADEAARIARDVDLAEFAATAGGYGAMFEPSVAPTVSDWRIDPSPPPDGRLAARRHLETDATVRIYERADGSPPVYHLEPAEARFDDAAASALADAYERLASTTTGDTTGPVDAVRAVAGEGVPTAAVARALRKHCHESGLLRDLFADSAVSDVFVTAPAARNAIRVRVDGEPMATNVTVTEAGVATLSSRFRRESGRGFSRAQPTLDAATTIGDRRIRVAGVTEPVTDGQAFAFRAHDRDVWTLPALVGNDTLSAEAAGLLSVCVERGGAVLLAGPRGSGKTTTLGALLWELPADVRTVVIEDTPELPVRSLQAAGRDVQGLRTDEDAALDPAEALRSALRLGDGALAVGEVRGQEATVLYEAMRIGANSEAVLGTIHGDGAADVFERVVSDLGVPASSFGVTDLVVTLETAAGPAGPTRRVRAVEEVLDGEAGSFATLFERTGDGLTSTARLARGNSRLVATLARPDETYADVRAAIGRRATALADRATGDEGAGDRRGRGTDG